MNRLTRVLGGFSLLAASGLVPAGAAAVGASGGTLVSPQPFAQVVSGRVYSTPPTTAETIAATGLASYSPVQIEAAYDMPALYAKGLNGAGKTIVLVDSYGSPTIGNDLRKFDAAYGLPAPPSFRIIHPVGRIPAFNPADSTMVSWAQETSLDVEYAHAMAPGANLLLVETPVAETEGVAGFPQMMRAEEYVIGHHLGDVISQSFGATEATFPDADALMDLRGAYTEAEAANVTVLAASGDAGATDYSNAAGTLYYTHRATDWPSTDPLVTSVGGTQLHLSSTGSRLKPDNVWNDTKAYGAPLAGGGGLSIYFGRPSWQDGVASVVGSARGVPDVALSAAVNGAVLVYMSFSSPGFYQIGGTSEATPLFAGVVAIADQAAGHDLGLLNPTLYSTATAPGISDITIGNNTVSFFQGTTNHTVHGWTAVAGYDLASGLGTIDGAKLVAALVPGS
jgi:subtilase family serine protease